MKSTSYFFLSLSFSLGSVGATAFTPSMAVSGSGCISPVVYNSYTTSPGEEWDDPGTFRIMDEVVIPAGQELIISNGTWEFHELTRIVVEPTAKLIIKGASTKLTSCSISKTWRGVLVKGDINMPSLNAFQGVMEIKNGATIERALDGFYYPNNGQNGGILIADNANFINCKRAAGFQEYTGGLSNSVIRNCTLKLNDDFINIAYEVSPGDYKIPSQVTAWNIDGLNFHGNSFINEFSTNGNPLVHVDLLGDAIHLLDASASLDSYNSGWQSECGEPSGNGNHFKGWNRGVYARSGSSTGSQAQVNTRNLKVLQATFEDNLVGVKVKGKVEAIIFQSTFLSTEPAENLADDDSQTGDDWIRISAVELERSDRTTEVIRNTITYERLNLAQFEDLLGVYVHPGTGSTVSNEVHEIGYNVFIYNLTNQPGGGDLLAAAINCDEYSEVDLGVYCNDFQLDGINGSIPNLTVSDFYGSISSGTADYNIGGVSVLGVGQSGLNNWTPYSIPCNPNRSHIDFSVPPAGQFHNLDYYFEGSENIHCLATSKSYFGYNFVSPHPTCNTPSWCDLFGQTTQGKFEGREDNLEKDAGALLFYPNPAQTTVRFNVPAEVRVYNASGHLVLHEYITNTLDVSALDNGIYFIQSSTGIKDKLLIKR